jgi:predicted DCC family thiol-disulfide oxidoreductase YuxK
VTIAPSRPPPDLFPGHAELLLLYDGECGLCRASAAWLRARDRRRRLVLVPLQTPGVLDRLGIDRGEAMRAMQAISRQGERRSGADAMIWAVSLLPGYRWLALAWRVAPLRPLGRWLYRQVALRRPRARCASGVCPL